MSRGRRLAAVVVGVVAVAAAACGDDGGAAGPAEAAGEWEELPGPGGEDTVLADVGGTVVAAGGGEVRVLDGDEWSAPVPVPGGRTEGGTVVGPGDELVVPAAGAAYEPGAGTWRDLPGGPAPGAVAVWSSGQVVLVGHGAGAGGPTEAGGPTAGDAAAGGSVPVPGGTVMAAAPIGGGAVAWTYDEPAAQAALWRLDAGTGRWAPLPEPPFDPPAGGAGLVVEGAEHAGGGAEGDGRLVATASGAGEARAAVLDLAGGGEWTPIDPPPVPADVVCPSGLHRGGDATVFAAGCAGDLAVLDGDGWWPLPPAPIEATGGEVLVTGGEVVVLAADGSALARRRLP